MSVTLYGPAGTGTDLGRLIEDLAAIVKSIQQGTFVAMTTPDADAVTKGKVQLAGDLAGPGSQASAPVVLGLAGKLTAASNLSDLANAATARTNLGLGSAATQAASAFQPVDADLSAIAALTTTTYGRAFLALADAAAGRAALGLGSAATQNAGDFDATGAAAAAYAAAIAASQPVDADLSAIAALTTTTYGRAFLALADAAAGRAALGLGSAATQNAGDFDPAGAAAAAQAAAIAASQPVDSDLSAIAALFTTAFGRGLLVLADAAAGRAALGLDTMATQAASAVAITGGTVAGITDLAVADGGTGASTAAAARTNLAAAADTVDAAAGTGSLRTLGAGATQAAAGNDARLSDQRVPTDGSVTDTKVAAGIAQSKIANLVADLAAKQATIPTGTYVGAKGARVFSVDSYGAKGDGRFGHGGAVTSGQAVVTDAAANFQATDVGKPFLFYGAGAAGAVLVTTIASRQSATQVTLSATAGTTVASGTYFYGTDDSAAVALARAAAAVVGGIVDFSPRNYYVPSGLLWASGVYFRGVEPGQHQQVTGGVDYASNFTWEWNNTGTVLVGDGTNPCFWDGQSDRATLNGLDATATKNAGILGGIGIDNFTYGIKAGAAFAIALTYSHLGRIFIKNCSQWGLHLTNWQELDVQVVVTAMCQNGQYWGANISPFQPGNSMLGELYNMLPNDNRDLRKCRGIVFETNGSGQNQVYVRRVQSTAYNVATLSFVMTFTNGSANIGVPDGTKFMVGMLIKPGDNSGGLWPDRTVVVKSVAGNVITVGYSRGSPAIVAGADGTAASATTQGFACIEVTSPNAAEYTTAMYIEQIDAEGDRIGMYAENVLAGQFSFAQVPATTYYGAVFRNVGLSLIYSVAGLVTDFDTNTANTCQFFGSREAIKWQAGAGMWWDVVASQFKVSGGPSGLILGQSAGDLLSFFGAAPAAKPTGVAVTAGGIHAALVSLGLISA